MRTISVSLVLVAVVVAATAQQSLQTKSHPPGANLTTAELIEMNGYPVEVHYITTEDGYILEVHRIPHGINDTSDGDRQPVLVLHGMLGCSADFILGPSEKALGFMLADAGYDVWLGNHRGNTYARNHTTLDPETKAFWKFSLNEMGQYDLPATIDAVLAATGRESLLYVGFSMGTTTFFAMMSERPEYNSKVDVMVALGACAYLEHMKGMFGAMLPYADVLHTMMSLFTKGELFPSRDVTDALMGEWCDQESPSAPICYAILSAVAGPSPDNVNKEYLPVFLAHTPAGTSVQAAHHYTQLVSEFAKYDYGRFGNNRHYGQKTPPLYSLKNVTVPVAILWGATDFLSTPEDVDRLAQELPNVVQFQKVDYDQFNHLDFIWALHADELVYRPVMEVLQNYRS